MTTTSSSSKEKAFEPESPFSISRSAATIFAEKWKDIVSEQQNDQAFWQDFFRDLLGINDLQAVGIEFQKKVRSSKKDTVTRIDVYWKDTFLVEHKSAGKDLDAAEDQAREYVFSLPPAQRPPIVIVCDFARFRIVDYVLNKSHEFRLENLADNLDRIEAIVSHKTNVATTVQVEADQKAAQLMADLYVQLEKYGYEGHEASVFMVRVLFCLFADDTRMWKSGIFQDLVKDTNEQGSDLGPRLSTLFTVLDTPKDQRKGPQDAFLADFPYVNGGIFSERLETIHFNQPMRQALINACNYDWSTINPTIFGALFQDIKSRDERRANGEHYTTEKNIDKTIGPLFIDELHEQLEKAWDNSAKLRDLKRELGTYQILDPACGCGNFLITTYKRLRQLELEIIVRIKQLDGTSGQTSLFDVTDDLHVKLEQLHGIEYVEWSSQIAKVAIYLTDHQENMKLEAVLGVAPNRFPLSHSANIVLGNALQIDWAEICPMNSTTIIVGNPPYLGSKLHSEEQRQDQQRIWAKFPKSGTMDYISNWFILGSNFVDKYNVRMAFVSTNSITQGDQPAVLWNFMSKLNIQIVFAHRSFLWENSSSGKAGVHCVIIAIRRPSPNHELRIYEYPDPKGEPVIQVVANISPYLQDRESVLVKAQSKPIAVHMPKMISGNTPRDGGFLSKISQAEAVEIRNSDPIAATYLRNLVGADELINGRLSRFCLWLVGANPSDIRNSNVLSNRVEQVRNERTGAPGPKGAAVEKPSLFAGISQPSSRFIAVPSVSSERRKYIPMDFLEPSEIINNRVFAIITDEIWVYSLLQSRWFTLWAEVYSSRMRTDYMLAASTVYNTYPFPKLTDSQKSRMNELGTALLDAHSDYPDSTLADLYDPNSMPDSIRTAHKAIDDECLEVWGLSKTLSEKQVLEFITSEYSKATSIAGAK